MNLQTLRRVAQDCAHEQWQTAVLKVGCIYEQLNCFWVHVIDRCTVEARRQHFNLTQLGKMTDSKQTTQFLACYTFGFDHTQSEMEKMKKTQHVQAVYIRKMQALPGKVRASPLWNTFDIRTASSFLREDCFSFFSN